LPLRASVSVPAAGFAARTQGPPPRLTKGKHQIRFIAVDKHPVSSNYYMGNDCLALSPAKE
jgi:hypothetical protein